MVKLLRSAAILIVLAFAVRPLAAVRAEDPPLPMLTGRVVDRADSY